METSEARRFYKFLSGYPRETAPRRGESPEAVRRLLPKIIARIERGRAARIWAALSSDGRAAFVKIHVRDLAS